MHPWEQPSHGALTDRAARAHAALPVLETENLRLRPAKIEDFACYREIYASPRWDHGEVFDEEDIWLDFCQLVAGWLLRGTGLMAIEDRSTAALLGFVLINHEYGDPEMELGWMLTAKAEGRGIAFEAAKALRDDAARVGVTELVSYIGQSNARSARLAERLGALRDATAEAAYGDDILVYRHPNQEVRP